jgi:hypothetical protein
MEIMRRCQTRQQEHTNYDKSAASFCRQVAAWVPDMFCSFYLAKNHKNAQILMNTKATEKN